MLIGGVQPRSPISANLGNLRWEGTITTGDWLLAGGAMDVQGQVQEQGQAGPRDDVATGFSQGRRQRQTQPAGDPGLADALPSARTQTNKPPRGPPTEDPRFQQAFKKAFQTIQLDQKVRACVTRAFVRPNP